MNGKIGIVMLLPVMSTAISCADEPLPPVRPIRPEPVLVQGWEIPDANGLRSALVRATLSEDAAARLKVAYCVQFCEYDIAKQRCSFYDAPESFFDPFRTDREPVYLGYACPHLGRPFLAMRMVVGPFWRRVDEKGLVAEVGVSPLGASPENSAEYSAVWGISGWKIQLLSPPAP